LTKNRRGNIIYWNAYGAVTMFATCSCADKCAVFGGYPMKKHIEIFDSTLRDGAQGEGISFSVSDKLSILRTLDGLGFDYVEAGNPGSNPKDMEFFEKASDLHLNHAKLVAFGSTRRRSADVHEDKLLGMLLASCAPCVSFFGKSSSLHVKKVLRTTLEENLSMIRDTAEFLKSGGREVFFDAEHFFDGYASDPDYAISTLKAAYVGGARLMCLCDTNGGAYPTDIAAVVSYVVRLFPDCRIAIHCHNDTGLATAGTLFAVDAGACQVQGTFIGFGERCGNADLSTIVPDLQLKRGYDCIPAESLKRFTPAARLISDIANIHLHTDKPYVGSSAFAHKGGMHVDGVLKYTASFEHVPPESVGNERRFLLSEVGGRTTVLSAVRSIDPKLKKDSPETKAVIAKIKELELYGYQFEAAQASVELLIRKMLGRYKPFFTLELYKTMGDHPAISADECAAAVIKVRVGGKSEITAAQGDGPVHALDLALKKALSVFYPSIRSVKLIDYKVRVMESRQATASKVRVLIESTDGGDIWSTVGVSHDIIEASWIALSDSIEYKLTKDMESNSDFHNKSVI
jgi:2-isopropylmalate synthase